MNNNISTITNTFESNIILNSIKGIKIWMILYAVLIFLTLISASAFIYIFISDYQFLIYLNIPNVLMFVVTLLFAIKYSVRLNDFRLSKNSESLVTAFKSQRNYFISLTIYVFLIVAVIFAYLLFLLLYVRGMK